MSRALIASYVSKLADVTVGMDILARAQFWEGASGYLPFQKIRGQTSPAALLRLIRTMMEQVNPALVESENEDLQGTDGSSIWWQPGNTRLYLQTLKLATAIVSKHGMDGNDIMQEDMARDDRLGSVFYSAGKQTAIHLGEKLMGGEILPSDAQVVARRFIAKHAIDAVRNARNRQRIEMENGGDIVQMTTETELDAGDWLVVIDRLLADPGHPLAKEFFAWLRDYANKFRSQVLKTYLDAVMSGEPVDQNAIAASANVSPAMLSNTKKKFFDHISALLAGDRAIQAPAILNILSDAQFLYQLLKGKVKGDKVADAAPEDTETKEDEKVENKPAKEASEKLLRSKVIRLAHTLPQHRAVLLAALNEGATKTAAKTPKKLSGKKLDKAISDAYYKHGNRVQINMMDITKIYDAGKKAYEGAETVEAADAALDEAMKAAIAQYRIN